MKAICLHAGPFGLDVAARMERRFGTVPHALAGAGEPDELLHGNDVAFVALWRPHVAAARAIDRAARRTGVPVVYAFLHQRFLYVGPVVDVRAGHGCFSCFWLRLVSQHPVPAREDALERFYATDEAVGIRGHLPAHADMAVAKMRAYARATHDDHGRFVRIDVLEGDVMESRIVAVHRCEVCRGEAGPRTERFTEKLVPALRAAGLA